MIDCVGIRHQINVVFDLKLCILFHTLLFQQQQKKLLEVHSGLI